MGERQQLRIAEVRDRRPFVACRHLPVAQRHGGIGHAALAQLINQVRRPEPLCVALGASSAGWGVLGGVVLLLSGKHLGHSLCVALGASIHPIHPRHPLHGHGTPGARCIGRGTSCASHVDGRTIAGVRRFVSGLCLTLMFVAVSLAQTAWWVSSTLGDTATFRDAVRRVAADPDVRAAMGDDLAGVLAGDADLSAKQSGELRGAVDAAVADPAFGDALAATLGGVHAALLAGRNPAAGLDLGAVQDQVRTSLASVDPRLAAVVPRAPLVREIDPGRLPWIPRVIGWIGTAVPLLVVAAALLLGLAVLVSRDRPRTLRRAGFVLIATVMLTLITRFVLPTMLLPLLPAGVVRALGAAVTSFLLGALIPGLVITTAVGVALVAAGYAWSRTRARPARLPVPAPGRPPVAAQAPGPPAAVRAPTPQPLPVAGPPIANPPAAAAPAVVPPVLAPAPRTQAYPSHIPAAPAQPALTQPAAMPTRSAPAPEPPTEVRDDEPGGWGPLRY